MDEKQKKNSSLIGPEPNERVGANKTCGWVCACVGGGVLRACKVVVCARACGKSVMNCDTFPVLQRSQLLKVRRDTLFFNYYVDQSSPTQKLYRV